MSQHTCQVETLPCVGISHIGIIYGKNNLIKSFNKCNLESNYEQRYHLCNWFLI